MNKIILILLFNILIYHLYCKNIYLLISLLIFLISYTLKMTKTVEGNSEYYKYNFANSLNKKVKVDREEKNLFGSIIKKLNRFLKRYIGYQEIPVQQPCIGRFDKWSKCSTSCGRGEQHRTFNITQKAGSGGIECIYEDGDIDKKECFNDICDWGEECSDNLDCVTDFCDPVRKVCGIENECTKNALHNCDLNDCEELGEHYHYNLEKGCDRFIIKNIIN